MSKLASVKEVIVKVLSDYQEHTTNDLKKSIQQSGILISPESSTFRTAIYQLKNSGMNIESRGRGVYCWIKEKDEMKDLEDFIVLHPEEKYSKRYVYVHADGKVILNGKLNNDIKSRKIEIRVSNDCEKIALIIDGENSHKFTKNGHIWNKELLKMVRRKKVTFPLNYEMSNKSGGKIWIGELKRNEKNNNL